jgi:hypothetical protein
MIRSHRVLVVLCLLAMAPGAWGQITTTTGPVSSGGGLEAIGGLPTTVKNASIIDAGADTQIKNFISNQLGKFREVNTDGVPKAREAVIAEAKGGSAAFLAKYADAVNAEVIEILKNVKDMRARLNAAIVVARVAELANNTKLEKAVLALLDKGQPEALKLWGMRAARPLLPELVKVNGEKPLIEAVLNTVKQFADNGPLAEDAYDALNPRNATAKSVPTIVDALLDLTAFRIEIYKSGIAGQGGKTLIPDLPDADSTPFINIFNQGVWTNLDKNKKQDVRSMQLACELLHWSAARGEMPAYRTYRDQLQGSIKRVAGGIFVAASIMNENGVREAAAKVNREAEGQQVNLVELIQPLCALIPQMKGFEGVHPPQPTEPPEQKGAGSTASDGAGTGKTGGTNTGGTSTGGTSTGGTNTGGNIPGATVQQNR